MSAPVPDDLHVDTLSCKLPVVTDHRFGSDPERLDIRLERMVGLGRITAAEAALVRAAGDDVERAAAVAAIQRRHARERAAAAVAEGRITRAEADEALQGLDHGGDPRAVRRLLGGRSHAEG